MNQFDNIINREGTNSLKIEGFRDYIFSADENMEFDYKDNEFIHMWVADMDFATPSFILDAIRNRLDREILGYTKIFDSSYYESVVGWTKRRNNWQFDKDELVTSPGIIPALFELVEYICTDKKDQILILTPSYAYFEKAAIHNNRDIITSDLIIDENDNYSIDLEDINNKIKENNIKLCIFCNPHNPTGKIWTKDELVNFSNLIVENDIWLISDEIHCDIRRKNKKYSPFANVLPNYEKLIIAIAQSKAFNTAGLMFSNIIIRNKELLSIWRQRHYDFENPLSIEGTKAAYKYGDSWLDELVEYLDDNFNYLDTFLKEKLPLASFKIPDATYLAWIDVSEYLPENVEDIPLYFANGAALLIEDGSMFIDNGDGYIRLNLAMPKIKLKEGLNRIESLLLKKKVEVHECDRNNQLD